MHTRRSLLCIIALLNISGMMVAQSKHTSGSEDAKAQIKKESVWIPDNGDGTFTNPIIYADYSDPDVIRVGNDYYMTSSSFSHFPGLPILHSKDLVNWKLIGHAVARYSITAFNVPQHGNGIWAPSIRYHRGEYYIYYGDPDYGIFMTKAKQPTGPWSPLLLVHEAKGWIDPCPFWDDDDNAYLVHAWAKSRSGIKSILTINTMNTEGTRLLDDGVKVFDGALNHPTIEGPKLYKRNGYYYIFAPAGGVKPGWQTVLRSKNIYGPYEDRIVLEQGSTAINGPHQGAWIETQAGESWFIHFQDRDAYGRIVHLQPMQWDEDWPLVGIDVDKNGVGEPVSRFRKPNVGGKFPVAIPQTSDEFNARSLGLQWQWESNPQQRWYSLRSREGWLRLNAQPLLDTARNLWYTGNILAQKFPAPQFTVTTKIEFKPKSVGEKAGLIVFGSDYTAICIEKTAQGIRLRQTLCSNAAKGSEEKEIAGRKYSGTSCYLRVEIVPEAVCTFSYSIDGKAFYSLGEKFTAKAGRWVGAKVGLFAVGAKQSGALGYADFDWVRFSKK
ncbi:MAG: glycoside hydrolase 43 family protein [bacterium]